MFGRIDLLTEGAQAEGLVTKAWYSDPGFNNRIAIAVRVKFPDGSVGECTDRMLWVSDVGLLTEGSVVPVRYDPAKQSRVAIDVPALKARHAPVKAKHEAERAARLEAQFEQLGTGGSGGGAGDGGPGRTVRGRFTYRELVSGETKSITIVRLANILDRREGEATESSPKGEALLGRAVGDRVMLPQGLDNPPVEVEILDVEHSGS